MDEPVDRGPSIPDELLEAVLAASQRAGHLGPAAIDEHIRHALGFADAVAGTPSRVAELGSGGGVPGLVVAALRWPATVWTLVEVRRQRVAFLEAAIERLGLTSRVHVAADRAEALGRSPEHRGYYDVVLARSFGPPAVVAECGAPLLGPAGQVVVSEPPGDSNDLRWPQDGLARVGLGVSRRVVGPPSYVVLTRQAPCPDQFPRRPGIPGKRPLF